MNTLHFSTLPPTNWDRELSTSDHAHFLQSSLWGNFKRDQHWDAIYLSSTTIRALILTRKTLLGTIAYIPRGPIFLTPPTENDFNIFITQVIKWAESNNVFHIKIEPEYPDTGFEFLKKTFTDHEFSQSIYTPQFKKTVFLDISNTEEEILASFKQKTRYNIRLAMKKGVQIDSHFSRENIEIFYNIHKKTGERQHFPVRPFSYYNDLWTHLHNNNALSLFIASHDKEVLGGVVIFHFGNRSYYQYGASTLIKRNLMAPHLLQFEAIKESIKHGSKVYDMVGLPETPDKNDPFYGVWKFKQGFGGDEKEFTGAYDWFSKPSKQKLWNRLLPIEKKLRWKLFREVYY